MLSTKAHPSKSVQGVTFSPSQPHHCATFSEKQIKLWDIRKFNDCVCDELIALLLNYVIEFSF